MDENTKSVEGDSTPRTSLTRRKALGLGAVAVGGAALGGLVEASGAEAAATGTTVLKAAAVKGATSVTVKSVSGFAAGDLIWIDTATHVESVVVKSVTTSSSKLTLKTSLQNAHKAGVRVSVIAPVANAPGPFKDALTKLVNDSSYSAAALSSPDMITSDYPTISTLELMALREYAILSGADISAINNARAALISSSSGSDSGALSISIGGLPGRPGGWSVSCCCSCCCGETGVVVR